jgi:hypothetical protein
VGALGGVAEAVVGVGLEVVAEKVVDEAVAVVVAAVEDLGGVLPDQRARINEGVIIRPESISATTAPRPVAPSFQAASAPIAWRFQGTSAPWVVKGSSESSFHSARV